VGATTPSTLEFSDLEAYRSELTGYCYRMLGSPFEAEDAVQDTLLRAWKASDKYEGRASVRSWLYRIATNVCLDSLDGRKRRATPMDLGPAREPIAENLHVPEEVTWLEPLPDPADAAVASDTIRLAFVAALQRLPARQRAALILCEVLHWKAAEVATLLDTSVASVNSALQRARATLEDDEAAMARPADLDDEHRALLEKYVAAFEAYDMEALRDLIREDATQNMPPFDLWLSGREDILTWWFGPGIGCAGSKMRATVGANGQPAFGQYKPADDGNGYEPWALQVLELEDGQVARMTFFLEPARLFELWGLPPRLD
jgi:RNA polymerase sigma-70 factor (ECF subfamily)